jgi:hypothetical protein
LQVGADIVKRALSYPLKLIAKNAGVNGSVVSEKVYHHSCHCGMCGVAFTLYCNVLTLEVLFFFRCFPVTTINMDIMQQLENMKI